MFSAYTMAILAVVSAAGLMLDGRTLDGLPIWAKPLKFAVSFVIYTVTWAWLLSLQRRARRVGWWAGTILAVTGLAEMAIIVGQAARGHRSHFNIATPLDATLFTIMGVTVILLFVTNLVAATLVLRERLADRATTWAVRLGLAISVVGLGLGGLMLGPKGHQIADLRADTATVVGAHSVGVPDGGPGLPILGWSTTGGDLRIPHFVGMHALQLMPLLALALLTLSSRLPALRDETTRLRLILIAGAAYTGLLTLVTWQALRGQPLIHPDALTLTALALLTTATATATLFTLAGRKTTPAATLATA
jgi:uncharacterized membrane protein YhaH (DUF805 family)